MAYLSTDGTKILGIHDRFSGEPFNAVRLPANKPDGTPYTDADVDNAYVLKVISSLGGGYAKRNYKTVDPISFGVKGDGITDDTVAIHNMLLKLKEGTCVDWGSGDRNYIFDEMNLVGVRYIKFLGSGAKLSGTVVIGDKDILASGMTYGFISEGIVFNHRNGTKNCYELVNARGVYINNTIIPTSLTETSTRYTNAIVYIRPLDKFQHVNRISVKNTHGRGNYLVYADNPIKIAPYTGIKMSLGDIELSGNADFSSEICCFLGFGVDGATVSHNTLFMSGWQDRSQVKNQCIRIVAGNWIKINNNSLFESGLEGILLEKCTNFNINNNNFAWSGQRDVNFGYGIRVTGGGYPDANYTTGIINNNVFALTTRTAIKLDAGCARTIVCDNQGMSIGNASFYYGDGTFPAGNVNVVPAINSVPHYMVDVDPDTKYCVVNDNNGDNATYNFPYDPAFVPEARAQLVHFNNNGGSGIQEQKLIDITTITAETIYTLGSNNIQITVGAGGVVSNILGPMVGDTFICLIAGSPVTFKSNTNILMANEVDSLIPFRGSITFQKRGARIYEISRSTHYTEAVDNFKFSRPRSITNNTSTVSNFDNVYNSANTRAGWVASIGNNNAYRKFFTLDADGRGYSQSYNNGSANVEKRFAFDRTATSISSSGTRVTNQYTEEIYVNASVTVTNQTIGFNVNSNPGTLIQFINPMGMGNLIVTPNDSGTPATSVYVNGSTGLAGNNTLLPGEKILLLMMDANNFIVIHRGLIDTRGYAKASSGEYADNAAATAAGLAVGSLYRTGDLLKIVH